jgi:hypothetical protein
MNDRRAAMSGKVSAKRGRFVHMRWNLDRPAVAAVRHVASTAGHTYLIVGTLRTARALRPRAWLRGLLVALWLLGLAATGLIPANGLPHAAAEIPGNGDPQTITFDPIANHTIGDAPFTISAGNSSILPVNFTVSSVPDGICSVSGTSSSPVITGSVTSATVTITGAGTCTITAHQPGDGDHFQAAPDVAQTFTISCNSQTGQSSAFAEWYCSDGGVDATFQQQDGFAPDPRLGTCTDLQTITGDFNGDGFADVLVYCPSTGAFQKLYGTGDTNSQFTAEPIQYVGNAPGAWTHVQMVAADFNGDGKTDLLVYRTDTGAYAKWFSDGGVDAGFKYQSAGYVANASGAWKNIQIVATDFNGDGKTDLLVYRTDTGAFTKWFSDGGVDPGFKYQSAGYVANASGAWTNIQMLAADFNGDGKTDLLAYRTDNGAYQKWYGDGGVDPGFQYQPVWYMGSGPGSWTNVRMVAGGFNGDGTTDILAYSTDNGAYQKWYSDGGVDPGFTFEHTQIVGGGWTNVTMIPGDFNGDGKTDILAYHT